MAKYAKGAAALGICQRCGLRTLLRNLVPDGYKPGLLVHSYCRDIKHPAEQPVSMEEGIALRRPAPDIDDDSAGNNGVKVRDLFPGEPLFGGGT